MQEVMVGIMKWGEDELHWKSPLLELRTARAVKAKASKDDGGHHLSQTRYLYNCSKSQQDYKSYKMLLRLFERLHR